MEIGASGHAWIYSGNNEISESTGTPEYFRHQSLDYYKSIELGSIYYWRITSAGASKLTNLKTDFSLTGTANSGSGTAIAGKTVEYSNFFFNGIPDGKYSLATKKNIFEIIVDALKELINMLIGLVTYLLRGLIIGIISICERILNNTVQSVDSPKTLQESGVSATSADAIKNEDRVVTIEGLMFNTIDLFDINIFKVD